MNTYKLKYLKYSFLYFKVQKEAMERDKKRQEELKEYELKYGSFDERLVKYFGNKVIRWIG